MTKTHLIALIAILFAVQAATTRSAFAAPDVYVKGSVSANPSSVTAGNQVTISYTVGNMGTTAAIGSSTRIQIKDVSLNLLSGCDWTVSDPGVGAQSQVVNSHQVTIPSGTAAGNYTIYIVLDRYGVITGNPPANDYGNGPISIGSVLTIPTVSTVTASAVGSTSATLNGQITSTGGATITALLFGWGTTSSCSDTYAHEVTINGNNFSYTVTGLTPGQTYYFQAWADNSVGWGSGSALSFTTTSNVTIPTVSTVTASAVGSTSATLNGQITSTGGATITALLFGWGTTSSCSDTYAHEVTINGNNFSYTVTGLTPGQKYYFQAWADNSAGWGNGSALSFTTTAIPATVTPATPAQNQIDATIPYKPPIAPIDDVKVHTDHLRLWDSSLGKWLSPIDGDYHTKLNTISGSGKPVVVMTHGWHGKIDPDSWTCNLAALLHAQDGTAAILAWDWENLANPGGTPYPLTDIGNSGLMMAAASATSGNLTGKLLAQDLLALKIDPDQTQLIGHSNGGAVMGSAAHVLAQQYSMHIKRLTTLDTPDLSLSEIPIASFYLIGLNWGNIFTTVWQLSTSVHTNQLYIDNRDVQQVDAYFSNQDGRKAFGFGSPLSNHGIDNVFNGKLNSLGTLWPGVVDHGDNIDHFRARVWYTAHNDPLNPSVACASWSILNKTNGWHAGNYDETGYDTGTFPNGSAMASLVTHLTNATSSGTEILLNDPPVVVYRSITSLTFDQAETWQGQNTTIMDTGLEAHRFVSRIQTGSDGYLFKDIAIPVDAEYLTFDYLIESPGAYLTLQFGDNVIFYQDLTGPTDWITTEHLYVGQWAGQTNTLLFTLHQVSGTASLLVDNITFSTTISKPLRPMAVDLNHDGIPNFQDFSIFANFWQNTSCSPPYWCQGSDFDKNGIVDIYDLQIFAELWLWPVADVDMDGAVNFTDYAIFASHWTEQNCTEPDWCDGTDFDHSGSVDMLDLAEFAEHWLSGS